MKLLTPKDAAELIGVSRSLIFQWCEERRLAHMRLGGKGRRGRIMIEEADLRKFLEANRVDAQSS